MIAGKYQAYPEYKGSENEWLGDIPQQWTVWKFKHLLVESMIYGANEAALDDDMANPRYIRITDMASDGTLRSETFKSLPLSVAENYLLMDGDILLARSGATVGKSFLFKDSFGSCCFAGYLIRARCHLSICEPRYAYWHCQSDSYWKYISGSQIQATIQNVSAEKYGNIEIPLPPVREEQQQIANFLDHETAKIDTLIEKQQQLIELLKEKRQAVISHAVTKGLNPNTPTKPSSVEWLGDVPEHWEVVKLGRLAMMQEGPGLRTWQFRDCGTRVICVTNITEDGIDFTRLEKFISLEEYHSSYRHFTVSNGDILLSSSGNSWGKVAKYESDEKVILNTSTIRLNELKNRPLILDYIQNFLQSEACREQLGIAMTGSCQPNFGPTHLNEVKTPIPPISEQKAISRYIGEEIDKYNQPIQASTKAIELMQERRTALISAAVTGKIDVRNWQAQKPSEEREQESA